MYLETGYVLRPSSLHRANGPRDILCGIVGSEGVGIPSDVRGHTLELLHKWNCSTCWASCQGTYGVTGVASASVSLESFIA